ncbi:DUF6980 family protein [Methylibium petroleiphilum]
MTQHCCESMQRQLESVCEEHSSRHECPDALIDYFPRLKEYGLIVHDGGSSSIAISFCPWCGTKLSELQK